MPDDFSFASLVKPGEGATRALRNWLHARQARDAITKKPWVYSGMADFLLQHGTFFTGRELPDKWEALRGPLENCHWNGLHAAEADPSLRYFTGLYVISGTPSTHSWCVDQDGGMVDVTVANAAMRGDRPLTTAWHGGPLAPMLFPVNWAYVGVEYRPAFIRAHGDERGLPILDPYWLEGPPGPQELGAYLHSEDPPVWTTPYNIDGFPVPPAPDLCEECEGWGCDDCNGTGAAP